MTSVMSIKKRSFIAGVMIGASAMLVYCCTGRDNALTNKEKEEGWELLFNGENLDGWRAAI